MIVSVEVVRTDDDFVALRPEWTAACLAAPQSNVFLTWEWASTWWEHYGTGCELHVVVMRDDDGIVGIAPLHRSQIGLGPLASTVLQRISPEAGDYGGIVSVRRHEAVADALVEHLAEQLRTTRVSCVMLSRVASDDPFVDPFRSALRRHRLSTSDVELEGRCLYADVRADFNFGQLTKKHKVRPRLRKLDEASESVEFRYFSGDSLEEGLAALLAVHARRWAGREDDLQGLLSDADGERFMLDVIRRIDEQGWLRLLVLLVDGEPVAAELDFSIDDRVVMFKGAFDPDFAEYSPGHLLHHRVVTDGTEGGIHVFDFGRGDHDYKKRWANGSRFLSTFTIARPGRLGQASVARLRANRTVQRRIAARRR